MNRRLTLMLATGTVGALAIAGPLGALPKGTEGYNKSGDTPATDCTNEDHSLVVHAPSDLWPPNHKYYTDIYALATSKDATEKIDLTTDGRHDQYDGDTEANGSGHTGDDITSNDEDATVTKQASDDPENTNGYPQVVATESGNGSVQTDWEARAERAGTMKPGRTYTLDAKAMFADGDKCTVTVTFTVPHDMRKANR